MIAARFGQRDKDHRPGCPHARAVQRDDRESPGLSGRDRPPLSQLAGWLANGLRAAGERLHAAPDGHARANGWQVTVRQGGLGRGYRDPRFDMLVSCSDCHGRGAGGQGEPCRRCSGTGRLSLDRHSGSGMGYQP
jgi:hypothetical protein